uniref:Nephrocystin 3-like N-terminal domain-containing protein n=1 Tax=Psilocybe cubensis TaxID=181762 RepID=A0A8H7XNX1_PSICU
MFTQSQNTLVTGGTFVDSRVEYHGISKQSTGFDNLVKASSPSAFYNAGSNFDSPKCHPNTRVAILDKIMEWVGGNLETLDGYVLWLYGPAGAGKSAVAKTIAERCSSRNLLLATYFFSNTDPTRNQVNALMATLAYQVALYLPMARDLIEMVVDRDPLIFTRSLQDQFHSLIIRPLLQLVHSGAFTQTSPRVIIIDGLDECLKFDMQSLVLDAISSEMQEVETRLPLRYIIASRPEPHLYIQFADPQLFPKTTRFPLDDKYYPTADIRQFLEDSFKKIKERHPLRRHIPGVWPTVRDIETLVNKSSGQFIYAATVIQYVSAPRNQPAQCLEVILGLRPPRSNHAPFAQLDALYTKIINPAATVEDISSTMKLLGFLLPQSTERIDLYQNVLKIPRFLEKFLALEDGEVQRLLIDLSSLIRYQDQDTELRVIHASFVDFLLDENRSKGYFIDPVEFKDRLSIMYCEFIQRSHISQDYSDNDEVTLLRYSCRQLAENCSKAPPSKDLIAVLLETPVVPPLFYLGTYQDLEYFLDFFASLESPNFASASHVYDHHLKVWDEYLLAELQNFPSLLYIYVCSVLLHEDFTGSIYSTLCCLLPDHWDSEFSHIKWLYTWDRSGYEFGIIERPSQAYRGMLLDFFADEKRSGRYMLSAKAYAAVSVLFLEYLSVRGTTKTRIGDRDESEMLGHFWESDYYDMRSPSSPPALDIEDDHGPIIKDALAFLPTLLSKSNYSGTLMRQIESHSFRDECKGLEELDKAKQAMLQYRERIQDDEMFQKAPKLRKKYGRSL